MRTVTPGGKLLSMIDCAFFAILSAFVRGVQAHPFAWLAPVLVGFSSLVMTGLPIELPWQALSLRTFAVLAGLTLDIFHRHADKVAMANIAQLVNCLQALFLTHEDKFVLTPTYHIFEMYAAHQGGTSLRTVLSAPRSSYTRNGQPATISGLSGSASLHDRELILTVTNPDLRQTRETEIAVRGAAIKSVKSYTLAANDIHAHNSFDNPKAIEPKEGQVTTAGGALVYNFAPASVTRLRITLT